MSEQTNPPTEPQSEQPAAPTPVPAPQPTTPAAAKRPKDPRAELGTAAVRALLVCALLVVGFVLLVAWRGRPPSPPSVAQSNPAGVAPLRGGKASVEVVEVRLMPFRSPAGYDTRRVAVDWKNTGDCSVRLVKANIKAFDFADIQVFSVRDYTIYAVSASKPGVEPCATYIKPPGEGFVLPIDAASAVRATVEITRVEEKGTE